MFLQAFGAVQPGGVAVLRFVRSRNGSRHLRPGCSSERFSHPNPATLEERKIELSLDSKARD
jgi:hypothetical protein